MAVKKKAYVVQTPVEHDQVRYEIGEDIELSPEAAAPLLAVEAIVERVDRAADGGRR